MYDWTYLWDEECFILNPFIVKEPKNREECTPCVNFEGDVIAYYVSFLDYAPIPILLLLIIA